MTSSSIEKSERSDVLTGNNELKGFGHSNLEEQVQILEHMLSTIKGKWDILNEMWICRYKFECQVLL